MNSKAIVFLTASIAAGLTLIFLVKRQRPFSGQVGPKAWTLGHAAILIGVLMGWIVGLQMLVLWWVSIFEGKEGVQGAHAPISPLAVSLGFGAAILSGVGGILFLVIYCKRMGWPLAESFGLRQCLPGRALGIGLCVLLAALPWVELAGGVWLRFLKQMILQLPESLRFSLEPQEVIELLRHSTGGTLLMAGVALIVVAPIVEELVFRGFVYPALKQKVGGRAGAILVSIFFASVHGNAPAFAPLLLLSLALVLAYELTGSLLTPMIVHSAFNTVSFVQLLLERSKPS